MRLVSIISTWADTLCLLPFCIQNHLQFCDAVIVVGSVKSNYGAISSDYAKFIAHAPIDARVIFESIEPIRGLTPLANETAKRNYGIKKAIKNGYEFTHFLISDADEFYDPKQMNDDKAMFDKGLNGLVHRLRVYVGKPTLWCHDHTLVPGIHKLTNDVRVGSFRKYPFAYDEKGNALIDPSRRPSCVGIRLSETVCHHYSYVRKNIDLKINNSSAKLHRYRQVIYDDLRDAKPGYVSKLYNQNLKECENYFNIQI